MPRSGTWYNNLFYSSYFNILAGKTNIECIERLFEMDFTNESGIDGHFRINHVECPGFAGWAGPEREAWNKLKYNGLPNVGNLMIDSRALEILDPSANQEVSIVYCYRNPLDQAVSSYQHAQKHVAKSQLLSMVEQNGVERLVADARDFLFSLGIDSYIKQFLTYRVMKKAYPDNLLLIEYEDLVRSPSLVFAQSLAFMGHPVNSASRQRAFSVALKFSSMESLKRIERQMGHSIADDQVDPEASHISDGAIGKWKRFFNQDDLQRVGKRLAAFGMSLGEFTLD
jgi:hypothetical protein